MDLFKQGRSKSRERARSFGGGAAEMERGRGEENGVTRKQMHARKMSLGSDSDFMSSSDENTNSLNHNSQSWALSNAKKFAYESRRRSSKKTSGLPSKMLIGEEISKGRESKRHSPTVVARLMGLDALPAEQPILKQRKRNENHSQKMSPYNLQEQCLSCEDHSFEQQQEFKDVYEVLVTPKLEKHKTRHVLKGNPSLKKNDTGMAFIRQKFMDAKRLSSDEKLRNSKEFDEALEALDCNPDLLLKFLQEPNSLFSKHLQDMQANPPPMPSQIGVLKPSNGNKYDRDGTYRKAERNESNKHTRKGVSKSQVGRNETCNMPTTIVLLKPNSEKKTKKSTPSSSSENFHYSYENHREFGRSGSRELLYEATERQKLYVDIDNVRQKSKSSRQIAREITKHMRYNVSSFIELSGSRSKRYLADERLLRMSGKAASISSSEIFPRSPGHFVDLNRRYKSMSSLSYESSMSREAKRHLSERWKMTHKSQEFGIGNHNSNTLREMLALSDKEVTESCLVSVGGQNCPRNSLDVKIGLGGSGSPLGISSRDGWKGGHEGNLRRSRSLPSSSSLSRSPKLSNKGREAFGVDNRLMLNDVLNLGPNKSLSRESSPGNIKSHSQRSQSIIIDRVHDHPMIELDKNSNEMKDEYQTKDLTEDNSTVLGGLTDTGFLIEHIGVDVLEGAKIIYQSIEEPLTQPCMHIPLVKEDAETSFCGQGDSVVQLTQFIGHLQGTLVDSEQKESLLCAPHATGLVSPSKNGEQPSPVSILEPPYEEEKTSPECFERVNTDLQGLRMQLQLLQSEYAEEAYTDKSETNSLCDGETIIQSNDGLEVGEEFIPDGADESRDLSYLLEVLVQSGFYGKLIVTWYAPEFPIDPYVFEDLEAKYGELLTWPKAERKLWFDRINSGLLEILGPCGDLHPWVKPRDKRVGLVCGGEALVEELCEFLIRQEKEGSDEKSREKVLLREMGWLILDDAVDEIGGEIEGYLIDDLLREVVSELTNR
ncbi:hypothetical protein QJS10_CPA07g00288 [Acorus calamus]|uniref:DUF4378 domain-containing protein n=1 Tax=Acorus calamus TaxID=4465 RepID=A0AAV9EFK2_ACOCL|nr:hypothetical protein QJS10_CPA07g00288 [Acorus calamus]